MSDITAYYEATAAEYDGLHGGDQNLEHVCALERAWPLMIRGGISSVLDVGCGTGRALSWVHRQSPTVELVGIDPSPALLNIARSKVPGVQLMQGTGDAICLADNSVDVAIATGIMHHVDDPSAIIAEMFRVSRKAILISDHNNFAFGSLFARRIRMALHVCGLLPLACYIKQGFNHKGYSKEDGWWYPYSLFENYGDIARRSSEHYLIPTSPSNTNAMSNVVFTLSHFAILAFKKP